MVLLAYLNTLMNSEGPAYIRAATTYDNLTISERTYLAGMGLLKSGRSAHARLVFERCQEDRGNVMVSECSANWLAWIDQNKLEYDSKFPDPQLRNSIDSLASSLRTVLNFARGPEWLPVYLGELMVDLLAAHMVLDLSDPIPLARSIVLDLAREFGESETGALPLFLRNTEAIYNHIS